MGRLEGFAAVVTGAASGIGRASASLFAREGARVVCVDRAEAVEETAASIQAHGGQAVAMTGDAGDEAFVEAYIQRAVDTFGGLDVVYANAGITGGPTPFFELTPEIWAEVLRINLIGPFLAIKHASKVMVPKGKGSIICTASVAGIRSGAGPASYSASKAGVI
ncbi:MAG TPA: SDR family NAD(P)-dependent oxidoreductase, partial [Phenylobacterium sp.]|nr:SDR family NAD(P)-dependent oxidoreductase [Phenylobacterium sp.]